MRSPHDGRRHRRPAPIKRTPEELALAYADALRWRADVRSERAKEAVPAASKPVKPMQEAPRRSDAEQRALFAVAIARAEFGRFYFKGDGGKPAKAHEPKRKRARNGKAPA